MICKRSLKLAKGNSGAKEIASQMVNAVPKRGQMATVRKLDAKVIARAMANVVQKVIAHEKANGATVIVVLRVVSANGLPKAIVLRMEIVARMEIVHLKEKVVEARCLGSLNCSIETKTDGSAVMNSIG